jgi:hypothetical protein
MTLDESPLLLSTSKGKDQELQAAKIMKSLLHEGLVQEAKKLGKAIKLTIGSLAQENWNS